MADWDVSPLTLPASTWGTIILRRSSGNPIQVQITGEGVLWLTAATAREDVEPTFAAWAMIQRCVGRGESPSLPSAVRHFSTTVNPAFQFDRSYYTPAKASTLPPAGANNIPGTPGAALWRTLCNSSGTSHTFQLGGGGMNPSERRELYIQMRRAFEGDAEAWQVVGRRATTRMAVYNICTARWGNPIPGYDNFAARAGRTQLTLSSIDPSSRSSMLSTVENNPGTRYGVKFADARGTNVYLYRSTPRLAAGGVVSIECNGRNSTRADIVTIQHTGSVNGRLYSGGTSITTAPTAVRTTAEGLAPTEEVSAGSSALSENEGVSSGESGSQSRVVLPRRAEIHTAVRDWARTTASNLGSMGGGRRS